jgi:pimeloyl-ACP methyl ester carboxylesterase
LLVLQGEHDEYATSLQTDALRPLAPQMHLVRLPDTGHTPHREHPEVVLDQIQAFLGQLPPQSSGF